MTLKSNTSRFDPWPIVLFAITVVIYAISSKGEGAGYNYHTRLAAAMLRGRLDYGENIPYFEIAEFRGLFFTVFPPFPAILLMPLVAIFGVNYYQPYLSIVLGSASVPFCYLTLLHFFDRKSIAIWGAILFAFGTINWYHAEVGSGWYVAQIVALFFSWSAIYFGACRKNFFISGLLFGAAYLTRIPTISCLIIVLLACFKDLNFLPSENRKKHFKNLAFLSLGILPGLIANILYNYFRFGTINNEAYNILFEKVKHEPWFQHGHLSIFYAFTHLREIFTLMPHQIDQFPFIVPRLFGMAIWITTPAFILILFANFKDRIVQIFAASLVIAAIPTLMHGGNGFTQFGYRHTLDYMPFLILLTCAGLRNHLNASKIALLILSIMMNLWGVATISWFAMGRI